MGTLKHEWTEEFTFVERAGSAVCLIFNDKISSMKRSNIKQHFDTHHATFASKYPAGTAGRRHAKSYCAGCKLVCSNSVYGPDKVTGIQLALLAL